MLSPNLRPVPADSDGALVHVSPLSYSFPLNSSALIDHHFVNSSIKALKFDAAASFQLPHVHKDGCEHNGTEESPGLLVVSPYVSQAHLLDLSTVSRPSQLFAKALTVMKPVHDGYATASYTESFNWGDIMGVLEDLVKVDEFHWRELAFYVIVFRSQVSPATDRSHLGALDAQSHAEAMISGGLLKYWFGEPDIDGRNLATCEFLVS